MAVDMFIKLNGMPGESKDSIHKEEIELLAWSWGASNSATAGIGGGMGAGKVNMQDISLTKYIDKASPKLLLAACNGTHIPDATLTVRKAGGTAVEYYVIKLKDLMVTSVSTGGSGGEDKLTENVSLNFVEVKVAYKEQDEKGAVKGGEVTAGWNVSTNKAA